MRILHQSNGNTEGIAGATYFESSGGLLLNATSIITGTSKDTEDDLKTAKRLQSNTKYKHQDTKVRKSEF